MEDRLDISGLETVVNLAPAVCALPRGGRDAMVSVSYVVKCERKGVVYLVRSKIR